MQKNCRPLSTGSVDYVFVDVQDARREIKQLVVCKTSERQQNGSFQRGRVMGRAETSYEPEGERV